MSASRIQIVSNGRPTPFLRAPDLSSAGHPWSGFMLEESRGRSEPVSRAQFPKTTIFLCTGGRGTAHRKHRGVWERNRIEPGSVFIVRRNTEIQSAWTSNSWPVLLLQIDAAKLQRMAPDDVHAIEDSLASAVTRTDPRLAKLMLAMREEVEEGCPSGRLYGEAISLALLAYLAGTYATPQLTEAREARLSPSQKRKLVAYIRANLSSNISVAELAGIVQMSPSHFSRAFKAAFGETPYRFVMRERVEGAKAMLASTRLSASQVSMAFGFSSQSHFVKVFRQFTGATPKQYRAGL